MSTPNTADLKPVVVVPVHRPEPTADEQFALRRCGSVLSAHSIRLVHPESLVLAPYRDLLPQASSQPVPDVWMATIRGYNRMMVNPAYYALFSDFSHMLIHEPDALVLRDELFFWCQKPFDYIGAPWFDGHSGANPSSPIVGVGNSGFSLIRVKPMTDLCMSRYRWLKRSWLFALLMRWLLRKPIPFPFTTLLKCFGQWGSLQGAHHLMNENCDVFLCRHAPSADPYFRIAPVEEALRFSWEVNPATCQKLTSCKSPFGIHAWARYDRNLVNLLLHNVTA
jgi:hypothetical protein